MYRSVITVNTICHLNQYIRRLRTSRLLNFSITYLINFLEKYSYTWIKWDSIKFILQKKTVISLV